jgi:hypothetical protein
MKAADWMKKNAIIPLVMGGITAICALVHLNSEVDPQSYRTLWQSWDTIPENVRVQIARDLNSHDYISLNEYCDLSNQLTVKYVELHYAEDILNVSEERAKVLELVNNPELRPYRPVGDLGNMRPVSPGVYSSQEQMDKENE